MVGVKGQKTPGNPNIKNLGFKKKENCTPEEWERHELYRSRQKGVPHKFVWTKEKCNEELDLAMTFLKKILKDDEKVEKDNPLKLKRENIRDVVTLISKISDLMRLLFPLPKQIELDATVDINLQIQQLEIQKSSILQTIDQRLQEEKFERIYKWSQLFTDDQMKIINEHLEKYFNKRDIEQDAKNNYVGKSYYRKIASGPNEIFTEKDFEKANEVKFILPTTKQLDDIKKNEIKKEVDDEIKRKRLEKERLKNIMPKTYNQVVKDEQIINQEIDESKEDKFENL